MTVDIQHPEDSRRAIILAVLLFLVAVGLFALIVWGVSTQVDAFISCMDAVGDTWHCLNRL